MDTKLEKMKDEVNKLKALLDDPQPGLFTWHGFVDERIKSINKLYFEKSNGCFSNNI